MPLVKFKSLPVKTKQVLILGVILALVVALPLFVWAIMTQRFDIRKGAQVPTPSPSVPSSVNWRTPYVHLTASDFYLDIGDQRFIDNTAATLNSIAPGNTDPDYTSLELIWTENDVEMRLNMYFKLEDDVWSLYEIKTYDGISPGEWIYYNEAFSPWYIGNTGQLPETFNPIDFSASGDLEGHMHFSNLAISLPGMIIPHIEPTPPPTASPSASPSPSPIALSAECNICEGGTYLECMEGLICQLPTPIPDMTGQVGICVKPDGSSDCATTPTSSPLPSPTPLKIGVRVKFGGVNDGSAEGAKATLRFVSGALNYLTTPFEFTHWGDGLYYALVQPSFYSLITADGDGSGYTIYVKGEKHVANKYCMIFGQSGPCLGTGSITIPGPVETAEPTFEFSNYPLEPGDLPPQDGKVDRGDFSMLTELMGKLCSNLTDVEKAAADLDYSGCINVRDAFLLRKTLETRYDDF